MPEKLKELQARLIGVSPRDYPRCLALFEEVRQLSHSVKRNTRDHVAVTELARRAERLIVQAVSAAQARGEFRIRGQNDSSRPDAPYKDIRVMCGPFENYSDKEFEQGLKNAKERGSLGRSVLLEELALLRPTPEQAHQTRESQWTKRGHRTMEHMAIQINAIAMGCRDVGPEEVSDEASEMVRGVFEDIGTIRSWLRKVSDETR